MNEITNLLRYKKTHYYNPIMREYLNNLKDEYGRDLITTEELKKILERLEIARNYYTELNYL